MHLSLSHLDRSCPLGEKGLMQHGRAVGNTGTICSSAEDDQGLQHKYLTFEIPVLSGLNQCKSRNSGHKKLSVEPFSNNYSSKQNSFPNEILEREVLQFILAF